VASTTALPPPTSIEQGKRPANFVCRLFCYKACAGQLRLLAVLLQGLCPSDHLPAVLLQGLCRSFHLPAVFAARPVPVGSSAGCFTTRPVPVSFATGPFCCNGLVLPCHALSACLCHDPMPAALVAFAPVHCHVRQDHRACCRDCPVGSRITGLHWQPVHRLFAASESWRVLQGLPCRQPHMEIAFMQPVHRLCSLRSFQGGGLGLCVSSRPHSMSRVSSRPHSLSPALSHKPETACEQPGSLSFPQSPSILGHGVV